MTQKTILERAGEAKYQLRKLREIMPDREDLYDALVLVEEFATEQLDLEIAEENAHRDHPMGTDISFSDAREDALLGGGK